MAIRDFGPSLLQPTLTPVNLPQASSCAVTDIATPNSAFQSSPMDTTALLKRLRKSRRARSRLLFESWQALESGDRAKFIAALTESTSNFAKKAADDRPRAAIALPESNLAALAHERGWTDLEFDLPIAARLVTQTSLELGD